MASREKQADGTCHRPWHGRARVGIIIGIGGIGLLTRGN